MGSDDDTIIRHGPLVYWLNYKVWGVKGYWIALALLIIGAVIGHKL